MGNPIWVVNLLKKALRYKKIIAKSTNREPIGNFVDDLLFKGDRVYFVPNDRVIEINESLGESQSVVLPSAIVEYFIAKSKHIWIMNECQCRDALDCKTYPKKLGCLYLGSATQRINKKLGRHVSKEEALLHVRKANENGLIHMVGRNKLDSVWIGVGPIENLLTVCFCCPCCCVWTSLPDLTPKISNKLQKAPGVRVSVNDRCTGCGACTQGTCFVDAIRVDNGIAVINDDCRGCGRCYTMCPYHAIDYNIPNETFVRDVVGRISSVVSVE